MREYIKGINPERIRWSFETVGEDRKDYKGVKFKDLESGHLTFVQLKNLAENRGYSILFFLEEGKPEEKQVHSIEYRTLANKNIKFDVKLSKLVRNVEKHRSFFLSVLEDLEEQPTFNPPELSGDLANKARQTRRWLGLKIDGEKYEITEYRRLIERKNILVFQSMGYNGKWKVIDEYLEGFTIRHPNFPVIFVKKSTPHRQVFTLFHELAHLLLHAETRIDDHENLKQPGSEKEKQANDFAGLCLLPDETLDSLELPQEVTNYEEAFEKTIKQYCVSAEVVARRLLSLRRISRQSYQDYVDFRTKKHEEDTNKDPKHKESKSTSIPRSYRHREPLHIFGQNYTAKILEGLENNHLTLNKASNYLDGLKITDLRRLEEYILYGKN